MRYHEPPRRNLFSYILPFLVIIILALSGFFGARHYLYSSIILSPESYDSSIRVSVVQGRSAYLIPWGQTEREPLSTLSIVHKGDTLSTEKGSRVEFRLFDGSLVRMNQDSTISFSRLEHNEDGANISLNVLHGEVYVEAVEHDEGSDFIILTPQTISQADDVTFLADTYPVERLEVFTGVLRSSIFHLISERKEPLTSVAIHIGEEIFLDKDALNTLIKGGDYFPRRVALVSDTDIDTTASEPSEPQAPWYEFELFLDDVSEIISDGEHEGGVDGSGVDGDEDKELTQSSLGNIRVISPRASQVVGTSVVVTGTYEPGILSKIYVNDKEATLTDEGRFEVSLTLSSQDEELVFVSEDLDGKRYLALNLPIAVDDEPPVLPAFLEPSFDKNFRTEIFTDSVVITGRAQKDVVSIKVTSDTHPPYKLQQYTPGDELFYYKASTALGNLKKGANVYTLQFFDDYGNVSTRTLNIFYSNRGTDSADASVLAPLKITDPVESPFRTFEETYLVTGDVLRHLKSISVNGSPVDFTDGDTEFSVLLELSPGENPFVFQAEDLDGNVTDVSVITLIRE